MNNTFSIKNFRSYGKEGATFELAPITILTGCNSSGKSSMVKAMAILSDMLKPIGGNVGLLETAFLDFSSSNNKYGLGLFSKVINNNAGPDGTIELSYSYKSLFLDQNIIVTFRFSKEEEDAFGNGHLSYFSLSNDDALLLAAGLDERRNWRLLEEHCTGLKQSFLNLSTAFLYLRTLDDKSSLRHLGKDGFPNYQGSEEELEAAIDSNMELYKSLIKSMEISDQEMENYVSLYRLCRESEDGRKFISDICGAYKSLSPLYEHKVLFYNPLIDMTIGMPKEKVGDFLRNRYSEHLEKTENYRVILDYIISDFENSSCDNFLDFYRQQESNMEFTSTLFDDSPFTRHTCWRFSWQTYAFGVLFSDGGVQWVLDENNEMISKPLPPKKEQLKNDYCSAIPSQKAIGIIKVLWDLESDVDNFVDNKDLFAESGSKEFYEVKIKSAELFYKFLSQMVEESLTLDTMMKMKYVGSSWPKALRLYTLDRKDEPMVNLLLQYRDAKQHFDRLTDIDRHIKYTSNQFTRKWMKEFGLGDDLLLETTDEGDGIRIKIMKGEELVLLADEGYGITQIVATLLHIETAIMESEWKTIKMGPYSGWNEPESQDKVCMGCVISIEEPETHLHPALQSKLAEMFWDAYQNYNIRFIVETHSEYLIRMSQVLVSKMGFESNKESDSKSPFRTYYIPKDEKPYSLGYRKDGRFAERFGDGFYNEASTLTIQML